MLQICSLDVSVDNKKLFENINLTINDNEIHVFMGPNGVGKSSIANVIIGNPNYKVKGKLIYNNEDITNLSIEERSKKGIYLISQTPIAIEGVTNAEMLRLAVSEKNKKPVNIFDFNKELESICDSLELDKSFIHKDINVGASGGERKKIELMHMWMLKPSLVILDEIDSGLDVDATKLVAKSIKEYQAKYKASIIIITHNSALINTFDNYFVHLFENSSLVKSGDKKLAKEILSKGFKELSNSFVISENDENE